MQRGYAPGKSFAQAFASLLLHYFGEDALLIIDANSRELKSLTVENLFRRDIESSPALSEKIVLRSVQLEERYHAQIKPRALNLFYVDEDSDRLTDRRDERNSSGAEREFFLQGTRKTFTLAELLSTLNDHPERFSPNVVTRPLYQDSLVADRRVMSAGPGEIAYFAQLAPAYEWAGLPDAEIIHPRVTATLIEERLLNAYSRNFISRRKIFCPMHMEKILRSSMP